MVKYDKYSHAKTQLNLKHFKMQTELDNHSVSQAPDDLIEECQAIAQPPMGTKEISTDKGAIKASENSDKLINCGATEEQAKSVEQKVDD